MNANTFAKKYMNLKPSKERFSHFKFSLDFVNTYLKRFHIFQEEESVEVDEENAIIDLLLNYNISSIDIPLISFCNRDNIMEDESSIFFATIDGDFSLEILKNTGEIVLKDWKEPYSIIAYCSKNQSQFLDCLIEYQKIMIERLFEKVKDVDDKTIHEISQLAGGDKYSFFYQSLLSP